MPGNATLEPVRTNRHFRRRLILFVIVAAAITGGYLLLSDVLTLDSFAQHEGYVRDLQRTHPLLIYGVTFLVYVAVTGLSLPGATALTLAYGWLFGLVRAVILVSFASTAGATLAFLLSRYLFHDAVQQRFANRLERFNEAWRRDGPYFLFTLRLIPLVPFFVINAVMGLTPVRTVTFWWVSQLGMLPGTIVYVYAGANVPSLQVLAKNGVGEVFSTGQWIRLFIAFALLGLFPLMVRWTLRFFGMTAPLELEKTINDESSK